MIILQISRNEKGAIRLNAVLISCSFKYSLMLA